MRRSLDIRDHDLAQSAPKKDPYLVPLHLGLLLWFGWIPFVLVFSDDTVDRYVGIGGLFVLLAFLIMRFRTWKRLPYAYARGKWEQEELIRYLQRRLEDRDGLLSIGPYEFESAVAQLYGKLGMISHQTPRSGDGGWDVEVTNADGHRFLVECKQFSSERTVGRPILQKLHSALVTEKAHGAICITTGTFTKQAIDFAAGTGIQLINGFALGQMMGRAYGDRASAYMNGLCRVCGKLASFDPDSFEIVFKECPKNHWVKHPSIADTHPSVSQTQRQLKREGRWTDG